MFGMIRVCESTFSAVNFMKSIIVVCYKCKKQPDFEHLLGNEKKNAKYLILLNIDHLCKIMANITNFIISAVLHIFFRIILTTALEELCSPFTDLEA